MSQCPTLVQVYQKKYVDGSAKGLGDCLRGLGCLMQLGERLGFEVEVDMRNHPVAEHLATATTVPQATIQYESAVVCPHINYSAQA